MIDDVGLLPVSADAAEALFRVVDAAYEKRSIAISSNIHPCGFDELMPKTLATATVDRLLHHAHVADHEGNATLNYRSVLAWELTVEDAEIYRRPGHRRRLRRVSAAGEEPESV